MQRSQTMFWTCEPLYASLCMQMMCDAIKVREEKRKNKIKGKDYFIEGYKILSNCRPLSRFVGFGLYLVRFWYPLLKNWWRTEELSLLCAHLTHLIDLILTRNFFCSQFIYLSVVQWVVYIGFTLTTRCAMFCTQTGMMMILVIYQRQNCLPCI